MPAGLDPPIIKLNQGTHDALKNMSYNSTDQAFQNLSGAKYFLFLEKVSGGDENEGQWFHATDSEGGINPRGQIPQLTYDIFNGGTYSSSTEAITYQSKDYKFRLQRDTGAGTVIAKAIEV